MIHHHAFARFPWVFLSFLLSCLKQSTTSCPWCLVPSVPFLGRQAVPYMATSHLFDQPIRGRKGNGMRQTSNPEKENQKQTNQECPRHAWHHASQAHSQALARAGPWAEALEPGPWPFGGSWALGPGLGPGRSPTVSG